MSDLVGASAHDGVQGEEQTWLGESPSAATGSGAPATETTRATSEPATSTARSTHNAGSTRPRRRCSRAPTPTHRPGRSPSPRSSASGQPGRSGDREPCSRCHSRRRDVHPIPEEVGQLLAVADDRFSTFIALCAFAGLRLGEAAGVQAGEVNFPRKSLTVSRQVQRVNGGTVDVRAPKYGSERTIYLADTLVDLLAQHAATHGTAAVALRR